MAKIQQHCSYARRGWPRLCAIACPLALLVALLAAPAALAQKKGTSGVIRLEETVIEGRVEKPNAFFINTRHPLVYEVMELKESFVAEIPKSVEEGPF